MYPFIYFLILIFTEIIELNFFGLSFNTRKNIRNREAIIERNNSIYSSDSSLMIEIDDGIVVNMKDHDNEI